MATIAEARPDLVERLVNPEDAQLSLTGRGKIAVWCEGVQYGNPPHNRVTYETSKTSFTSKSNSCPACNRQTGYLRNIENSRPDLIHRVVNPEDLKVMAQSNTKKIKVRCDEDISGVPGHPVEEYYQIPQSFTKDVNECTYCSRSGRMKYIENARPDLVERLPRVEDHKISITASKKIQVSCSNGHPTHSYLQEARSLVGGMNSCKKCNNRKMVPFKDLYPELLPLLVDISDGDLPAGSRTVVDLVCNGGISGIPHQEYRYKLQIGQVRHYISCPMCSTRPKYSKLMPVVLEGIIDHIENLSGAQKMALVLRRHGIKEDSPAGKAILAGDVPTLREMQKRLNDGDEEAAEEIIGESDDSTEVGSSEVEQSKDIETDVELREIDQLPSSRNRDSTAALEALASIAIGTDEQGVEFLINSFVHNLWQDLYTFDKPKEYVKKIRERLGSVGNEYSQEAYGEFIRQYDEAVKLKVPTRWGFYKPNLMQKHMAMMVKERFSVGNWSGAGSGKTASAVLSAMVSRRKKVLVVCPNNTVKGWENTIKKCDPSASVESRSFTPAWSGRGAKWLVMNFDKFSGKDDESIAMMKAEGFDMMVIDELHWIKERGGVPVSKRRQTLKSMRDMLGDDAKVLGMSATPVVNDLTEGKSMISLIEGKEPEFGTAKNRNNIQALHENMVRVGFRSIINPPVELKDIEFPEVDITSIKEELKDEKLTHVDVDALVTTQYFETIAGVVKESKDRGKGTMIYTEYLAGIDEPLAEYLEGEGLRVAWFTGDREKVDVDDMIGKYDALIGTQALGTGVDGVQKWADTVVYATLPWTSAGFEQSKARVYRQGSTAESVRIVIPNGVVTTNEGDTWSWTKTVRWGRIVSKADIAAAAVDGAWPDHLAASAEDTKKAAIAMLERMDGNGE